MVMSMSLFKFFLCGLIWTLVSAASAFDAASDLATFRSLDHAELRTAEAQMDEFLEPGTARLLREPRNAAERYVVQRQQRLAAEFNQRRAPIELKDSEHVQPLFWPMARASQLIIGEDGQARITCQPASIILGREPPDFRASNHSTNRRAVK